MSRLLLQHEMSRLLSMFIYLLFYLLVYGFTICNTPNQLFNRPLIKARFRVASSSELLLYMIFLFSAETATGGVLLKSCFLKISQNSQENTCVGVSFLIKLQASVLELY